MNVKTVFDVSPNVGDSTDQRLTVEAVGQEAATAIMKKFPNHKIILVGFYIGDVFKYVNLN